MIITDATSGCNDSGVVAPRGALLEVRADSGPLGIVTKTPSPEAQRGSPGGDNPLYDPDTGEIFNHQGDRLVLTPQESRANRWAFKSVVNRLLPGSRTSKCMVLRAPIQGQGLADIELCMGQTHKKAFYQGLLACGGVWTCPVCSAKISERRRTELQEAMKAAESLDMRVHFVTLTVPHGIGDDLQDLLDKLSDALKRLSHGKYSIKNQLKAVYAGIGEASPEIHGYIRALEVTHGQNGYHPHFHILVFTDKRLDSSILRYVYAKAWKRACLLSGLPEPAEQHGVTVQDGSKAAKYASKWGLEDEMTKAHAKTTRRKGLTPWGMLRAVLDDDDPEYPAERAAKLFQVYAKAFHGRRQLYWSNGLRKLLQVAQELTDQELVAKPEDERALLLATLTDAQWKGIRRRRQEAHILTVAESAPLLLQTVLEHLVPSRPGEPDGAPRGGVSLTTDGGPPPKPIRIRYLE